jgi:hypothetical protein
MNTTYVNTMVYIHDIWKYYIETVCSYDEFKIGFLSMNIFNGIFFLLVTHTLLFIDVYEWPKCLYKYKIEPTEKLNWERYVKTVPPLVVKTLLCVQLPASYISIKILNYRKCAYTMETFPGLFEVRQITIHTHSV